MKRPSRYYPPKLRQLAAGRDASVPVYLRQLVREHPTLELAATSVGVSYETLRRWRAMVAAAEKGE